MSQASGFNEAGAIEPRNRRIDSRIAYSILGGFNEAGAIEPRNRVSTYPIGAGEVWLQ